MKISPQNPWLILGLLTLLPIGPVLNEGRNGRFVSLFQIVRFQNGPCVGTSSKNGTCYTQDECSSKGGSVGGTCAAGYGVCCTFVLNCGGVSSENCTYFESSSGQIGACRAQICPCSNNICQLRLDFEQFVITGPSTDTTPTATAILGQPSAMGLSVASVGQCLTDVFSVSNPGGCSPPSICGINTGEHMYVAADESCNDLLFRLGQTGVGSGIPNRQWSIKVTQYSCDYKNLAPEGCTQYFFDQSSDSIQSFNYAGGKHLTNQDQNICIRRERGNCRICYTTALDSDFDVSGTSTNMGFVGSACCNYLRPSQGYDCVLIPGARKVTDTLKMAAVAICGRQAGLVTISGTTPQTICSNRQPFSVRFRSDSLELAGEMGNSGFKLIYIQSTIGC